MTTSNTPADWPALRVNDWTDTRDTLHMWVQIVERSDSHVHHWSTTGGRSRCTSLREV